MTGVCGKPTVCLLSQTSIRSILTQFLGHILKAIMEKARGLVVPYQNLGTGAPDPSYIFQLPNDIHTGSNLFGFQKSFEGFFQFDVLYESGSVKQKLSCK